MELENEGSFDSKARLENLEELGEMLHEWQKRKKGSSIEDFLDDAALLSSCR
ncbi:MAG: hypothetical protein R2865_08210 [Deinococcales bacterium]